jgi:hypothetical protein
MLILLYCTQYFPSEDVMQSVLQQRQAEEALARTDFSSPQRGPELRSGLPAIALAVAVGVLVFLFHLPFAKRSYLVDDSADYLRAAKTGLVSLYLNTDSASPVALMKMRGNPHFRAAPWDYLYFRNDDAALRHFHTPFSFYVMHAVHAAGGSDRAQRMTVSIVTATTCAVLVFGLSTAGVPLALAGAAALLAGWQTCYIEVSVDPTPHSWYMLFAMTFLFLLADFLVTRRIRSLVLASIALGFAFATLEFSLQLMVAIPFALLGLRMIGRLPGAELAGVCRQILRVVPIFLGITFLLWPGGWLRGGYLETYGVLSATVALKNKHAFGEKLSAGILYDKVFAHHEIILAVFLFFAAALIYLALSRKASCYTAVFSSYAVIALGLGVASHFRLTTYVSEFLLFLIPAAALMCNDLPQMAAARSRHILTAAGCALLLLGAAEEGAQRKSGMFYRPWLTPVFAAVRADVPKGSTVLVNNNLEDLYLYVPGYDFEPTIHSGSGTPRTTWRASGARYYLFEKHTPAPAHAKVLGIWPTYGPGHELVLYATKN